MRTQASQVALVEKNSPASAGDIRDTGLVPGSRSPGVGNGNLLQLFLPRKCHGQRSLVGYSPWGHKVLGTTEQLSAHTHERTMPLSNDSWQ